MMDNITEKDMCEKYGVSIDEKKAFEPIAIDPFVLTGGKFHPGEADAFYENILDPERKAICRCELLYYRGDLKGTREAMKLLKGSKNLSTKFAFVMSDALISLSLGDSKEIMNIYNGLKNSRAITDRFPGLKTTISFFSLFFHILIHNKADIVLPEIGLNAFSVPDELKPMALYTYAHYLNICGDYNHSIGLAESALILVRGCCPVSEIYLALITCIGYISRGDNKRAEYYFKYAWDMARPDGIIMPFVELRGLLSGVLEKILKKDYHEAYKKISELAAVYHRNWVAVHNDITGETVSDKLTVAEFNVAMLASKGFSNDEIGTFLGISVNSVRAHLRNIFNKLDIESRKDLYKFVIK